MCSAAKKPPLPPQSSAGVGLRTSRSSSEHQQYVGYGIGGVTTSGGSTSRRRAATDLGNPAAIEMAKARAAMLATSGQDGQAHHPRHHHQQQHWSQQQPRPVGLLETDLDAPVDPEEAVKARSLLNLNGHLHHGQSQHQQYQQQYQHQPLAQHHSLQPYGQEYYVNYEDDEDASLHHHLRGVNAPGGSAAESAPGGHHQRPHKSMEFLLDKENLHFVKVSVRTDHLESPASPGVWRSLGVSTRFTA